MFIDNNLLVPKIYKIFRLTVSVIIQFCDKGKMKIISQCNGKRKSKSKRKRKDSDNCVLPSDIPGYRAEMNSDNCACFSLRHNRVQSRD